MEEEDIVTLTWHTNKPRRRENATTTTLTSSLMRTARRTMHGQKEHQKEDRPDKSAKKIRKTMVKRRIIVYVVYDVTRSIGETTSHFFRLSSSPRVSFFFCFSVSLYNVLCTWYTCTLRVSIYWFSCWPQPLIWYTFFVDTTDKGIYFSCVFDRIYFYNKKHTRTPPNNPTAAAAAAATAAAPAPAAQHQHQHQQPPRLLQQK